jgi:hypothetical protein
MNYTVLSLNTRPEFLPNHKTTDNDEEKFAVKYWSGYTLKCVVLPIFLGEERSSIVGGSGHFPSKTVGN